MHSTKVTLKTYPRSLLPPQNDKNQIASITLKLESSYLECTIFINIQMLSANLVQNK